MKSMMPFAVTLLFKLIVSLLLVSLGLVTTASANTGLWQALDTVSNHATQDNSSTAVQSANRVVSIPNMGYENARLMKLDKDLVSRYLQLNQQLNQPLNSSNRIQAKSFVKNTQYDLQVPLPDGSEISLTLEKEAVLSPELAAKFPNINTYRVLANAKVFTGKVDISDSGFHAMLQMLNGDTVFIDPVEVSKSYYAIYKKGDQKAESGRKQSCGVDSAEHGLNTNLNFSSVNVAARNQIKNVTAAARSINSLINYRIAVSTTSEYSAKFGSVKATLAAITTTISRVNQVLERDLGIHLNIIENNDLLINIGSDPFVNSSSLDLVHQNQTYIDTIIGSDNYDIGHLFTTSGGGLAAVASVCSVHNKAKAFSGVSSPSTDSFDLDFVAHEIGHQLGATHTFNSIQGACNADTRAARTAFEPGSGSTIMSYAGYCGSDNIVSNSDAMYHIGSIKQIVDYTQNSVGSSCGEVTSSENTPPVVDAGTNYVIPTRTPFELNGKALDSDGDTLIYAWEQVDSGEGSVEYADTGDNALFRVHPPKSSTHRSFPPLDNILNHKATRGESLPISQRYLNMSFVAQDGFNPAQSDEMTIKVVRTGSRFALNYPRAFYTVGNTYPVYWNVGNTDKAPVNCSNVDISLSIDGGQNFSHAVANNVLNNGEAQITIPADLAISSQGRFKLKCSDNIFYAVSSRNFFVTKNDTSVSVSYANEDAPESNLEDISPDSILAPPAGNSQNTDANSNGGGGSVGFFVYFLLLLCVKKFSCRK